MAPREVGFTGITSLLKEMQPRRAHGSWERPPWSPQRSHRGAAGKQGSGILPPSISVSGSKCRSPKGQVLPESIRGSASPGMRMAGGRSREKRTGNRVSQTRAFHQTPPKQQGTLVFALEEERKQPVLCCLFLFQISLYSTLSSLATRT